MFNDIITKLGEENTAATSTTVNGLHSYLVCTVRFHISIVHTQVPLFSRNNLNTNLMHVTAIKVKPEVAFLKLPST